MLKSFNGRLLSSAAFAAPDTGTAAAQGINTGIAYVQHQSADKVFQNVALMTEAFHKASTMLIAGLAQFIIVRQYDADDNQRWDLTRSRDWLKAQLNERGLKQAMIYRYIATAVSLCQSIVRQGRYCAIINAVLTAKDERKGHDVLMKCIETHSYLGTAKPKMEWNKTADEKTRFSIDVLRVNLGLDTVPPIAATPATGETPVETVTGRAPRPGNNTGNGSSATGSAKAVVATQAAPASIVSRIVNDIDAVKDMKPETVMAIADKVIGRREMGLRMIGLASLEDCIAWQSAINNRIAELAHVSTEHKTEVPANDMPVSEPEAQPTDETPVETAPATTGRSRKRRHG